MFARGFTVLGGVFWITAAFAGPYVYGGQSLVGAFGSALAPLLFTIAVLAIGWFYERLASLLLAVGAIGTVAWGVIETWPPTVWAIMLIFFIAPTVVSALLFFLAGTQSESRARKHHSSTQALS
jgi:fucose permease